MEKRKINFSREMVFGIILTVFLVISSSIVTYAYASPYSYVSLDVNPSISFTLNRFNRVISVDALNEDGKEIISNTKKLKNKTIEEAISDTVNQISKEGYLGTKSDDQNIKDNDTENENDVNNTDDFDKIQGGIVITVSNKDMKFSDELTKKIENRLHKLVGENVVIEASSIGLERVKEAEKLGVSPGKLNLVEKLKASSPNPDSINTTEWIDKSVKDIMKAIHQNKVASKEDAKETNTEADLEDQSNEKDDLKEVVTEAEDQDNEVDTEDQQKEEIEHKSPEKVNEAKVKAAEKTSEAEKRSAEKAKEAQKHALEKEREALKEDTEDADEAELKDDEESRDNDHKFTEDTNDSNDSYHDQDEDSNSMEDNED